MPQSRLYPNVITPDPPLRHTETAQEATFVRLLANPLIHFVLDIAQIQVGQLEVADAHPGRREKGTV